MHIKRFTLVFTFCSLLLISGLQAQKFGYLNSQQLLLEMPEIKQADTQLETYQKQLITKGEQMVKSFEEKYQATAAQVQKGELSQIQIQQKESELNQEQQKISQYELEVQQKIAQKREELYKPILDKVKTIIEQTGKENGYTMIFDTSTGSLLHAEASEDLMPLIKSKLGI